jgi:hypothetical protein
VEKLVNRQAEEGEKSNREWVFQKDTHLKPGRRVCATKERESQSVGSRAITATPEMIVLMPSLAALQKIYNIALVVRTRCQLLG